MTIKKTLGYLLMYVLCGTFTGLISPPFWLGFLSGIILSIGITLLILWIKLILWLLDWKL